MIYYSYQQFPELAHFQPNDRRAVWTHFASLPENSQRSDYSDRLLMLSIIVCMIIGVCIGMFAFSRPSGETVIPGMLIGVCVPLFISYLISLNLSRQRLKTYLASASFSLGSLNQKPVIATDNGKPVKYPSSIDEQYYLYFDETTKGPYTLGQVRSMWDSGAITSDVVYWKEGLPTWVSIALLQNQLEGSIEVLPSQAASSTTVQPQPDARPFSAIASSPLVRFGCLFWIAMLLLLFYLKTCVNYYRDTAVSTPASTPRSSPTAGPTPKQASPEELRRLSEAVTQARENIDLLLHASKLSTDVAVSDKSYIRDDAATVQVELRLLSIDGQKSYMDGSLKREVYPTIKGAYLDSLQRNGFKHYNVYVTTDVGR